MEFSIELLPYKNLNKTLLVELAENKIIIRFTSPETRNPLSIEVLTELHTILNETARQSSIETIIFTGSKDVFASGANLREIAEISAENAKNFALRGQNLMGSIAAMPQQTVAAINGYCFGGALDLALACKKRIASPNAVFCHPGVDLGIITGWSGTQRLPRIVGEAKALEMFLMAKRVDAKEALNIGLIDEIVETPLEFALANY